MKIVFERNQYDSLYLQIASALKEAMVDGRIQHHQKLPSVRALASQLEVSKSTIEHAYDALVLEGYAYAVPKSGYYCDLKERHEPKQRPSLVSDETRDATSFSYTLTSKAISLSAFETKVWRKYMKDIFAMEDVISCYGLKGGETCLKQSLRQFLCDVRGVYCDLDDMVIGAGISPLLYFVCRLFRTLPHVTVGFLEENATIQAVFEDCRWDVKIITKVDDLKTVDVLYLTGHPALRKINQKISLMTYVRRYGLYVIEDDYTMEMHYLQEAPSSFYATFKDDCIFYINSFSKLLLPSIRMACLIVPKSLEEKTQVALENYHQTASKIEQWAFSRYIDDGHLKRRLKSLRKENKMKYEWMSNYLGTHGIGYYLDEPACMVELMIQAPKDGFQAYGLDLLCNEKNHPLLYFSQVARDDLEDALQRILDVCRFSEKVEADQKDDSDHSHSDIHIIK